MDESPRFILPSADSISIDEEETFVTNLTASDHLGNTVHDFRVEGVDKKLFLISNDNELILKNISDFESKSNYIIDLVAIDSYGNNVTKALLIAVRDGNIFFYFTQLFLFFGNHPASFALKNFKKAKTFFCSILLKNVNFDTNVKNTCK